LLDDNMDGSIREYMLRNQLRSPTTSGNIVRSFTFRPPRPEDFDSSEEDSSEYDDSDSDDYRAGLG